MPLFATLPKFVPIATSAAPLPNNLSAIAVGRVAHSAVVGRDSVCVTALALPAATPAGEALTLLGGAAAADTHADHTAALPWLQAQWCQLAGGGPILAVLGFASLQLLDLGGELLFKHALSVDPSLPGSSLSFDSFFAGGGCAPARREDCLCYLL